MGSRKRFCFTEYILQKKNILNSVITKIFYTRVHRTRKEAKRGSDHKGEKQFSLFRYS